MGTEEQDEELARLIAGEGGDGDDSARETSRGDKAEGKQRVRKAVTKAANAPPRGLSKAQRIAAVKQALTDMLVQGGIMVGNPLPTASYVLVTRTPATVEALCKLAESNPNLLVTLEKITKVEPYSILIGTGIAVGGAVAVDIGRLKPYHPVLMGMGVTEAWCETHEDQVPAMLAEVKEKAPTVYDAIVRNVQSTQ